ncbi:hypothetical protein B0H17DRAFT_1211937 [Mycena rosella]|uniref:Uncharacterized protein n=1 Tax=Mycena rosella TaxID=1033263 RepID=A0AAD7CTC3_MYCRO|nr:hypothetical protein B0H17DRAFT_1211937 [Mycena rosella]
MDAPVLSHPSPSATANDRSFIDQCSSPTHFREDALSARQLQPYARTLESADEAARASVRTSHPHSGAWRRVHSLRAARHGTHTPHSTPTSAPHLLRPHPPRLSLRASLRALTGVRITPPSPTFTRSRRTPIHIRERRDTGTRVRTPPSTTRAPAPQPADVNDAVHIPHPHPRTGAPPSIHISHTTLRTPHSAQQRNPRAHPLPRRPAQIPPKCRGGDARHDLEPDQPPVSRGGLKTILFLGDLLYSRHIDPPSSCARSIPDDARPASRKSANPQMRCGRRGTHPHARDMEGRRSAQLPALASAGTKTMRRIVRSAIGGVSRPGRTDADQREYVDADARGAWTARVVEPCSVPGAPAAGGLGGRRYADADGGEAKERSLAARKCAWRMRAVRVLIPIRSDRIDSTWNEAALDGLMCAGLGGVDTATGGWRLRVRVPYSDAMDIGLEDGSEGVGGRTQSISDQDTYPQGGEDAKDARVYAMNGAGRRHARVASALYCCNQHGHGARRKVGHAPGDGLWRGVLLEASSIEIRENEKTRATFRALWFAPTGKIQWITSGLQERRISGYACGTAFGKHSEPLLRRFLPLPAILVFPSATCSCYEYLLLLLLLFGATFPGSLRSVSVCYDPVTLRVTTKRRAALCLPRFTSTSGTTLRLPVGGTQALSQAILLGAGPTLAPPHRSTPGSQCQFDDSDHDP